MSAECLNQLLVEARRSLTAAGIETAGLDARILVSDALGLTQTQLMTRGDSVPGPDDRARIFSLISRRALGEPVGRILGRREFRGLDFHLGPDVLEPRPDTELLVETALEAVAAGQLPGVGPDGAGLLFADLGTGSGAIAISLLVALPGARAIMTDISAGALSVAVDNAGCHGVAGRVEARLGSWLQPINERLALILSNPPYIASEVVDGLDRSVRDHDPRRALDGGADGLDAYRIIIPGAREKLLAGGMLMVEIGFDQGSSVSDLFHGTGFTDVRIAADLAGNDRVVSGKLP